MAETQEPKAKKKPTQAPPPPILAQASAAWIRDNHHPRLLADEACALMALVFKGGRHQCRAVECPIQCPRHPDYGAPAPPPAWNAPPPPPLTPAELAAAELGLAPVRALRLPRLEVAVDHVPGLEVAVDDQCQHNLVEVNRHWAECTKCGDGSFPLSVEAAGMLEQEHEEPLTAAQEAIWAEQVDAWVGPAPAPAATAPSSSYPPCAGCGRVRVIMLVMAASRGQPAGTLCSFCYRGDRGL